MFKNVANPINLMSGYTAVTSTGNSFVSTSGTSAGSGTAFTPPYSVVLLDVSAVESNVSANAGATLSGNICGSF